MEMPQRTSGKASHGRPPVYASASVHLKLPDEVCERIVSWGRALIPDDWLFHPNQAEPAPEAAATGRRRGTSSSASSSSPSMASNSAPVNKAGKKGTVARPLRPPPAKVRVYLPPCGRVEEPHVTIRGGLREADFDAIKRDLESVSEPYALEFGHVAVWNSGYYGVVVVNVMASKAMNDLFRQLGRHPTQSTSDKGRNNLKPHTTIAYLRKDKVEPFLHVLQSSHTAGGKSFMLNHLCTVDRFEFGWRDGTATVIPVPHSACRCAGIGNQM